MDELRELNEPYVDFLILADRAEVLNGKLYMMGGGWDRLTLADFDQPASLSLAIGVVIPWNATNQPHFLTLRVETSDNTELSTFRIDFTPGRPPILRDAESQRVLFAISQAIQLPRPGTYVIKGIMNDRTDNRKETYFHASLGRPEVLPKQ